MKKESTVIQTDNGSLTFIHLGEREQQLDMLLHVQQFSSLIVLLNGSDGTGKSALLAQAQAQLSSSQHVIYFDALHNSDDQSVIACMASQLSCTPSLDFILQVNVDDQKSVLVDDAHLLEPSALLLLVQLSISQGTWHLVLCGDDSLTDKLKAIQLKQQLESLYHHIILEPLSEEGSSRFITQLYLQEGHDEVTLSPQKIHQLWLLSGGLPGQLIELIDAEKEHKQTLKARFPLGHVTAIMLIGIALVFSFMYQDESQVADTQDVIAQLLQEKMPEPLLTINAKDVALPPLVAQPILEERKQLVAAIPKPAVKKPIAIKAAQQLSEAEMLTPVPAKKRAAANSKVSPSLPVITKPKAKSHPLLAAQPNEYLLQLLGVRTEKSAQSFMTRFARQLDAEKLNVYQTKYKGQPWFVVVYGPFNNEISANTEASSLVHTLKRRPWIRPVSKIQEDIRQFIMP
jgi:DamX protein